MVILLEFHAFISRLLDVLFFALSSSHSNSENLSEIPSIYEQYDENVFAMAIN